MRKYSKKFKLECLELYLNDKTLKQVAAIKKIPFETVKTWHSSYDWATKLEESKRKASENLQELVSQDKAQQDFDVRKELIKDAELLNQLVQDSIQAAVPVLGLETKPLKPIEVTMLRNSVANLLNTRQRILFSIAKIDGLIVDKGKLEVELGFAEAITKLLSHRRQRLPENNSGVRLLPRSPS